MPHIHTGPGQHDLTASAYIIRLDTKEPSIMLHMHKKLKKYLQFGGHVELHETPWQTIIHELKEESGYGIEQLELLQPQNTLTHLSETATHPYPLVLMTHKFGDIDHYHTDASFAFVTNQLPRYEIEDGESADIRLFTKKELLSAGNEIIPDNVKEIVLHIFDSVLQEWEKVDAHSYAS